MAPATTPATTIADVRVDLLRVPLDAPYFAAGKKITAYWHVLARIRTTDGVEGFGYVVLLNDSLMRPLADATRELGQLLVGMDVFEPEKAWAKLDRAAEWIGPGGMVSYAIAPLDIAIWDAMARWRGSRSTACSAASATACRPMPRTACGTRCRSTSWRGRRAATRTPVSRR